MTWSRQREFVRFLAMHELAGKRRSGCLQPLSLPTPYGCCSISGMRREVYPERELDSDESTWKAGRSRNKPP